MEMEGLYGRNGNLCQRWTCSSPENEVRGERFFSGGGGRFLSSDIAGDLWIKLRRSKYKLSRRV